MTQPVELKKDATVTIDGKTYRLTTNVHLHGDAHTGVEASFELLEIGFALNPVVRHPDDLRLRRRD